MPECIQRFNYLNPFNAYGWYHAVALQGIKEMKIDINYVTMLGIIQRWLIAIVSRPVLGGISIKTLSIWHVGPATVGPCGILAEPRPHISIVVILSCSVVKELVHLHHMLPFSGDK